MCVSQLQIGGTALLVVMVVVVVDAVTGVVVVVASCAFVCALWCVAVVDISVSFPAAAAVTVMLLFYLALGFATHGM